ncbi:Uncharacterized conserved protein YecT, DUF1311 family [Loktanella fryxellensis]|uniref:Uncharacterized conserved protein YecT, DUF1311 family n=1 Tax=Loktanella fryxellensis TaxID=245187 RepID=A0A1H8BKU0_9RHOB|nr:lysozyme inhibitor LprI family protein [Loktanella fryxellensis]SEM83510.1 Uncharacterized conserved protein YecT, DUF1311 family [Loktanella fryxellensis]
MKIVWQVIAFAVIGAAPALAQDLLFDDAATRACVAQAEGSARMDCVGRSAEACMTDNVGGDSTIGMGGCLSLEWEMWDAGLNAAYADLLTLYTANDAQAAVDSPNAPKQVPALRDMQRAWIGYRDARCAFEVAKWGGGTGQGPASAQCRMLVTAEQTFVLRDGLAGLQ